MRYIEGINRKRKITFPEYIDDYITEDSAVRVIDEFVMALDIEELGFEKAIPSEFGRSGYDPRDLLKLYIYGYMNRVTSSRRLEAEATRNIEVIWLLRCLKPDDKTISDFRKNNKEAIPKVFKQFVSMCKDWNLFGMEVVAIDGSKFRASNSKKNNFSDKSLARKIKYIDEKIQKYMDETDANDESEKDIRKPSSEDIKQRIKELTARKETYEKYKNELKEKDISQISTTDPDSRLMAVNNNGVDVCYNVQTVVDSKHCLIVDYDVINNPTDHGQLSKMGKRAKEVFRVEGLKALADKGYYNTADLKECELLNIETYVPKQESSNSIGDKQYYHDKFRYDKEENIYVCPAGQKLYPARIRTLEKVKYRDYKNYRVCKNCEFKDKCTKSDKGRTVSRNFEQELLDKVDERTKSNKDLYKKRQMIVEHPFGTIKRGWGMSYFLTKGLKSVKSETSLAFLAYNMKRVINIVGIRQMIKRLEAIKSLSNLYIHNNPIIWVSRRFCYGKNVLLLNIYP